MSRATTTQHNAFETSMDPDQPAHPRMDPDQAARMHTGSMLVANPLCWFCHDATQIVFASYVETFSLSKQKKIF
jgi:hypothetical protein